MNVSRNILTEWLIEEFKNEFSGDFSRLSKVPDTRVIRFLDGFGALTPSEKNAWIEMSAQILTDRLFRMSSSPELIQRFTSAMKSPTKPEGVRYSGVKILAARAKSETFAGWQGWLRNTGVTGFAEKLPEYFAKNVEELIPVRLSRLRKQVEKALFHRFSAESADLGSQMWRYKGRLEGTPFGVIIRYSGKTLLPQLTYQVELMQKDWPMTLQYQSFESLYGVGGGYWDYITEANAARSVEILCDLIAYVVKFPERLPREESSVV